jgi:DNA (cytosine-5)-methyltransferase 1
VKVIDLFCGAGGSTLGFKMAGFDVVLGVDIDEVALSSYTANHPEIETWQLDILDLTADQLPEADVILGSTPCTEFSLAKRIRTYDMTLTNHFLKIVKNYKPKYWILENVPSIAYFLPPGMPHNLLCAANYGVPQQRLRCIAGEYPYPPATHAKHPTRTLDGRELLPWVKFGAIKHPDGAKLVSKDAIAGAIKRSNELGRKKCSFIVHVLDEENVLFTITATEYHGLRTPSTVIWDQGKLRRLSFLECVRGQSFPDHYVFKGTLDQRFHQLGDAVPPLLARAIAEAILRDQEL